jgi:uncharacterized protein (TIGR02266 family)
MAASAASDTETHVERRRSERAEFSVEIAYSTIDAMFSEFTRNINEGGLFVATEKPLGLEERVSIRFHLPGSGEPVDASGRVVRTEDGRGAEPAGMAIEFDQLSPQARQQVDALVRELRSRQ